MWPADARDVRGVSIAWGGASRDASPATDQGGSGKVMDPVTLTPAGDVMELEGRGGQMCFRCGSDVVLKLFNHLK